MNSSNVHVLFVFINVPFSVVDTSPFSVVLHDCGFVSDT